MKFVQPNSRTFEFANGVTKINSEFENNQSLETIVIPTSVASIAAGAFKNCTALQAVLIQGVHTVTKDTFAGCTSLETIAFGESVVSIGEGAFENCKSLEVLYAPPTLQQIGPCAFANCTSLRAVKFSESEHITIACNAFQKCTSLNSATLPPGANVDSNAFSDCTSLIGTVADPKLLEYANDTRTYRVECGEASTIVWQEEENGSWSISCCVNNVAEQKTVDAHFFKGCQFIGDFPGGTLNCVYYHIDNKTTLYKMPSNTKLETVNGVAVKDFLQGMQTEPPQ